MRGPGNAGEHGQVRRRQPASGRPPRQWGSLSAVAGVCILIGCAAAGALVTVLTGTDPGYLLGLFVVGGTAAAAIAVRARAVYLMIPVPALAYAVAAPIAGLIEVYDRAAATSLTALAASAAQWIASGFIPMTGATVLAVAMTAARRPGRKPGPRVRATPGRTRT